MLRHHPYFSLSSLCGTLRLPLHPNHSHFHSTASTRSISKSFSVSPLPFHFYYYPLDLSICHRHFSSSPSAPVLSPSPTTVSDHGNGNGNSNSNPSDPYVYVSFFHYFQFLFPYGIQTHSPSSLFLHSPKLYSFRLQIFQISVNHSVLGRIYVSHEGINGQVIIQTGQKEKFEKQISLLIQKIEEENADQWKENHQNNNNNNNNNNINNSPVTTHYPMIFFSGDEVSSLESNSVFSSLRVKVKKYLVKGKMPILHSENRHCHRSNTITPEQWQNEIYSICFPSTVSPSPSSPSYSPLLLDVRNYYESAVGRFHNAQRLKTMTYKETFGAVDKILNLDMGTIPSCRPIYLYCTGGIRCEKVSFYLKQKGFTNVKSLEGGINNYIQFINKNTKHKENQQPHHGHEVLPPSSPPSPSSLFIGKNFVFDHRHSVSVTSDILTDCFSCGKPNDSHSNCVTCDILITQCEKCQISFKGNCGETCQNKWETQNKSHLDGEHKENHPNHKENPHPNPLSPTSILPPPSIAPLYRRVFSNELLLDETSEITKHYKGRDTQIPSRSQSRRAFSSVSSTSSAAPLASYSPLLPPPSSSSPLFSPSISSYCESHSSFISLSFRSLLNDLHEETKVHFPFGFHMVSGNIISSTIIFLISSSLRMGDKDKDKDKDILTPYPSPSPSSSSPTVRILDIGTFTGCSLLSLCEGAKEWMNKNQNQNSNVEITTVDMDRKGQQMAEKYLQKWKETSSAEDQKQIIPRMKIQIIPSDIMKYLRNSDFHAENPSFSWDFIFLDCAKTLYLPIVKHILQEKLLHPKGILVVDNTMRKGKVVGIQREMEREREVGGSRNANEKRKLKSILLTHQFNVSMTNDSRIQQLILPIHDGLSVIQWK